MNIQALLKIADIDMYYNKHEKYKFLKDVDIDRISIPASCLSFLKSIQEKDMYTFIHSQYTAYYAYLMAKEMQLPQKTIEDLFIAGWLHDIGKMLIPNAILRKPGILSDEEFNTIKEHVTLGVDLLSSIDLSDTVKNAIMQHHERWDGGGYPYGIAAENITIEGRIMQIADTFSALTIKRIYKPLLQPEDAIKEIQSNSGTQFDPNLVNLLTGIMLKL